MTGRRRFLSRTLALAAGAPFAHAHARARAAGIPPAAAVQAKDPVLASLLARNREKHPGDRTSNHLSMALFSLAALGGSPAQIRALGEEKLSRRQPFPTGGPPVTARSWGDHLGNPEALPGLRRLFDQEIARRGVGGTLRLYLPALLPGLGAHAFHAIIRTGYGVRFADPAEVAMGLAYWAVTYLPLGALAPLGPDAGADPAAALAAIRKVPLLTGEGRRAAGIQPPGDLNIAGKMGWASRLTGFGPAASALRIEDGSLAAIARAMVRLHVASGDDFTALHAVTGTHAYRMLEPYIADRTAGRRYLWQALVGAYVSIGAPAFTAVESPRKLPTWTDVVARAARSGDDHELKLTDIAREESLYHRNPTYLHSAALHLGLV